VCSSDLILNIILVPRVGLVGAAWATLIAYAVALALFARFGARRLALPFPFLDAGKIAAAAAAMAFAVSHLPAFGGMGELALKAGVGAIVYASGILGLDAAGARGWVRALLGARGRRPTAPLPPVEQ